MFGAVFSSSSITPEVSVSLAPKVLKSLPATVAHRNRFAWSYWTDDRILPQSFSVESDFVL